MNFSKVFAFFIIILGNHELFCSTPISVTSSDETLRIFQDIVDLQGDRDAFIAILKEIVKNPVGQALVMGINNLLTRSGHGGCNRYKLEVKEITKSAEIPTMSFIPPVLGSPSIKFTNLPVPLTVFDVKGEAPQTTQLKNTDSDVMLFHEMLHWAHFLLNSNRMIEDACIGKSFLKTRNAMFLSNAIFKDFPVLDAIKKSSSEAAEMYAIHHNQWKSDKTISKDLIKEMTFEKAIKPCIAFDEGVSFFSKYLLTSSLFPGDKIYVEKVEEVRTIIGSGDSSTLLLDQFSENAYRLAKVQSPAESAWLRYGHGKEPCALSETMIEWVVFRASLSYKAALALFEKDSKR